MANEEKKTEKNKPKPCPKWLSAEAKKEWRRIAKIFAEEEKEFTDKDLKALEAYCTNYAKWQKCEQIIDEKGYSMEVGDNGYEQQRPEVSMGLLLCIEENGIEHYNPVEYLDAM